MPPQVNGKTPEVEASGPEDENILISAPLDERRQTVRVGRMAMDELEAHLQDGRKRAKMSTRTLLAVVKVTSKAIKEMEDIRARREELRLRAMEVALRQPPSTSEKPLQQLEEFSAQARRLDPKILRALQLIAMGSVSQEELSGVLESQDAD